MQVDRCALRQQLSEQAATLNSSNKSEPVSLAEIVLSAAAEVLHRAVTELQLTNNFISLGERTCAAVAVV